MKDQDPQLRRAAVWISEQYLKQDDSQVIDKLRELKNDPSYDVRTQLVLSLHQSKVPAANALATEVIEQSANNEMLASAQKSLLKNDAVKTYGLRLGRLEPADRKSGSGWCQYLQDALCILPRPRWERLSRWREQYGGSPFICIEAGCG